MGRILAIDFGTKRTGLAWTDPLQLSINPLTALSPDEVIEFIRDHEDEIEKLILGFPLESDGSYADATLSVINFKNRLINAFPSLTLVTVDESYSSQEARAYLIQLGYKKKYREKKENIDKVAAAIILQRYLDM